MPADIVLTEDTLRYISLFETVTKTAAIDCMDTEDKLVFIVEKGKANVAVGKKGEHVIRLKELTGKNIQVVEYSEDQEQFVMNVFHIYGPQKVVIEQRGTITHATVTVDPKLKGRAIGKAGKNLRLARDIVNRHHDIQSLSVERGNPNPSRAPLDGGGSSPPPGCRRWGTFRIASRGIPAGRGSSRAPTARPPPRPP